MTELREASEVILRDGRTLKQALEEHQSWLCYKNTGKELILSNEDISYTNLSNYTLQNTIVEYSNLEGCEVNHTEFALCNIRCTKMKRLQGNKCNFYKASMYKVDMSNSVLDEACFDDVEFGSVQCINGSITHASMLNMNIHSSLFEDTDFSYSDMRDSVFKSTFMIDVIFNNTNIDRACFALSCNLLRLKVDKDLVAQLLYHLMYIVHTSDLPEVKEILFTPELKELARTFDRVALDKRFLD